MNWPLEIFYVRRFINRNCSAGRRSVGGRGVSARSRRSATQFLQVRETSVWSAARQTRTTRARVRELFRMDGRKERVCVSRPLAMHRKPRDLRAQWWCCPKRAALRLVCRLRSTDSKAHHTAIKEFRIVSTFAAFSLLSRSAKNTRYCACAALNLHSSHYGANKHLELKSLLRQWHSRAAQTRGNK